VIETKKLTGDRKPYLPFSTKHMIEVLARQG